MTMPRHIELARTLRNHLNRYHSLKATTINDSCYDQTVEQLKGLESLLPELATSDSQTSQARLDDPAPRGLEMPATFLPTHYRACPECGMNNAPANNRHCSNCQHDPDATVTHTEAVDRLLWDWISPSTSRTTGKPSGLSSPSHWATSGPAPTTLGPPSTNSDKTPTHPRPKPPPSTTYNG